MKPLLGVILIFAAWSAYTFLGACLLASALEPSATRPAHAVRWTERQAPCFFLDDPLVWNDAACDGDERRARWAVYCQPDPTCMENPDGTSYLKPEAAA